MFCPQCGSTQSDELRFCKTCGANLAAVKLAVANPERVEGFDWDKTWVGEMMMTRHQRDRVRGITPELKRRREIKAGIITTSTGVAITVLLYVLMEGIIASGVSDKAIAILSRLWIVGIVPLLVGLALIFNGVFLSKPIEDSSEAASDAGTRRLDSTAVGHLPPANTNEFISVPHSVTDHTTQHLTANQASRGSEFPPEE